jgi:hypothetical protein
MLLSALAKAQRRKGLVLAAKPHRIDRLRLLEPIDRLTRPAAPKFLFAPLRLCERNPNTAAKA